MTVANRRTRAHWQLVSMELKNNLRGLVKFGQDRNGSIALKFALMVAGPMVFIDAVVGFFR